MGYDNESLCIFQFPEFAPICVPVSASVNCVPDGYGLLKRGIARNLLHAASACSRSEKQLSIYWRSDWIRCQGWLLWKYPSRLILAGSTWNLRDSIQRIPPFWDGNICLSYFHEISTLNLLKITWQFFVYEIFTTSITTINQQKMFLVQKNIGVFEIN